MEGLSSDRFCNPPGCTSPCPFITSPWVPQSASGDRFCHLHGHTGPHPFIRSPQVPPSDNGFCNLPCRTRPHTWVPQVVIDSAISIDSAICQVIPKIKIWYFWSHQAILILNISLGTQVAIESPGCTRLYPFAALPQYPE